MSYDHAGDIVLAIYPTTRGIAFALMKSPLAPIDWGVKGVQGPDKNALCLETVATLLEVKSESVFRVRAYQRAGHTLEALAEDVETAAARGDLTKLPSIGKDLAARIAEYLQTGRIAQLEALRAELPATFVTLLQVRGLGPKTARALHDQLGVDSIEGLEELCRSKRIVGVAGVREKTRENILKGIALWKAGRSRTLLAKARAIAEKNVMWVFNTGLRMHPPFWRPPGYMTEASLRRMLANPPPLPSDLTFEQADALGYIIHGSPATVRDRLRVFSDELRAGIVCSGMNGGSHEATLEMMQMFAEEVMPHFREDAHVDETAGVGR